MDQKLGYALSGEIEKAKPARVAHAVYTQLNPQACVITRRLNIIKLLFLKDFLISPQKR